MMSIFTISAFNVISILIVFNCFFGHLNPATRKSLSTESFTGNNNINDNNPGKDSKQVFLKAYSCFIHNVSSDTIKMNDGSSFVWDDKKSKGFTEKFIKPDLKDMFSIDYVKGPKYKTPPDTNYDPGRIRNELFFKSIYGASEKEVRKNLITVNWFGHNVLFNKLNGGADSLKRVEKELALLPQSMHKYFLSLGGTFKWRYIAGTKSRSMHSFGMAIDINVKYSDYWRNSKVISYNNQIPIEIVNIFEKHGFIWGGKWYHYDTMHFEFRPELIN